jgi:hypothetical protein
MTGGRSHPSAKSRSLLTSSEGVPALCLDADFGRVVYLEQRKPKCFATQKS